MAYKAIPGTKDILPAESYKWQYVEKKFRQLAELYNFREIRTPAFEQTQLFARGIGELTDIVGKEMYTFTDRSGNSVTLKPEMTAGVIRAYLQHNLGRQQPVTKVFYISPMFRQERPQKGRLRQFHQFGLEILGTPNPDADAEIIILTSEYYKVLNIANLNLKINSVGCEKCRPRYREKLKAFLAPVLSGLSPESQRRFESNPLRILDSKSEQDRDLTSDAPLQLNYLCSDCETHFQSLQNILAVSGTEFTVDGRIVRGLDYYTKTAFEYSSPDLGAQDALSGGGRYDLLAEELGGEKVPAVGVAGGIERLLIALESVNEPEKGEPKPAVYIASADEATRLWLYGIARILRRDGIQCETDLLKRSLKAQMREASRQDVRFTVIAGTDERSNNEVILKNMRLGEQVTISADELSRIIKTEIVNSENGE